MTKISVIIPTYRNPAYLDLCLKSIFDGQMLRENQILCVVDGFEEESGEVLAKYPKLEVLGLPENRGMQYALNMGVFNAVNENVFIVNDDNVFGRDWDIHLLEARDRNPDAVITANQVERTESMFQFRVENFGNTPVDFRYSEWISFESLHSQPVDKDMGHVFPFLIKKAQYMMVGGFDTMYPSPFAVDWDFFFKLQLVGCKFKRTYGLHLYHFGSAATKNGNESARFTASERVAHEVYAYKWGILPFNEPGTNSKIPRDLGVVKGIDFSQYK